MKESKIIWFNDPNEPDINRVIKTYEAKGWEVKEHKLSMAMGNVTRYKCISILFQRERV